MIIACQWCKDLVSWGLAKGFAWTIGLLLVIPFLLVLGMTLLLIRSAKRHQAIRPPD